MTIDVCISKAWFDEVKGGVSYENAFIYGDVMTGKEMVEVSVNEEEFNRVSVEKGWM